MKIKWGLPPVGQGITTWWSWRGPTICDVSLYYYEHRSLYPFLPCWSVVNLTSLELHNCSCNWFIASTCRRLVSGVQMNWTRQILLPTCRRLVSMKMSAAHAGLWTGPAFVAVKICDVDCRRLIGIWRLNRALVITSPDLSMHKISPLQIASNTLSISFILANYFKHINIHCVHHPSCKLYCIIRLRFW